MYKCTEQQAVYWAIHTMINTYSTLCEVDSEFRPIALIRLIALKDYLNKSESFNILESLNETILKIKRLSSGQSTD